MVAHLFTHMELYNLNFLMTSSLRNVAFHQANLSTFTYGLKLDVFVAKLIQFGNQRGPLNKRKGRGNASLFLID